MVVWLIISLISKLPNRRENALCLELRSAGKFCLRGIYAGWNEIGLPEHECFDRCRAHLHTVYNLGLSISACL